MIGTSERTGGGSILITPAQIQKFGGTGAALFLKPLEVVCHEILRRRAVLDNCISDNAVIGRQASCKINRALQELKSDLSSVHSIVMAICDPRSQQENILIADILREQVMLCIKYS